MGNGHFELGRSIRQSGNYFKGKMHETRIWGEALTALRLQTNSLRILSGAENGLLAYYPMNEGKGSVAFDKAHGSNARSEEHTSELQSLMRISYAVFCLKKKK